MHSMVRHAISFLIAAAFIAAPISLFAAGTAGELHGTVTDTTGAVISGATITLSNPVSGFSQSVKSASDGTFDFANVPFNPYRLTISIKGFATYTQSVDVESAVAVEMPVKLSVSAASTTVEVTSGGDLTERDTTFHTDVDRGLFDKVPLESQSSAISSLVTLTTPGIAADSNGLFHGLGDHAENSFSVDGQPITDQQSKVFSNQIPLDSVQSLEVISGAPPAEFGDKTSIVIKVTTRSGLDSPHPNGSVTTSYGAFGTSETTGDLATGNKKFGNFVSLSAMNSGRFLDPPEFTVMHDKGNEENAFDRIDYVANNSNSYQLNLGYTRSWFQTPNAFENLNPGDVNLLGYPVTGPTDQRSQIGTFNIAPSFTHIINDYSVATAGAYVRRDNYFYYPSNDPLADLGPSNLQQETVAQHRTLTNAGLHSEYTYTKGAQNIKAGVVYEQTFLTELFSLGIIDPSVTASDPTILGPYDLTAGGHDYNFNGHTDVKELAMYVEDAITKGNWLFNLGIRGDLYNGLTVGRQAEPRLGISYNIKPSNTVLRISYARTLETPFNENLVLSSLGCQQPVLADMLLCSSPNSTALTPGWRNEFHVGFQQALSRYFVTSGEYIWKETHDGFDFSVLGATPITFPIEWHNSKIPGWALRGSMPTFHGVTAMVVMSSVAARFFAPQIAGAGASPTAPSGVFRIDHDEKYNETTHVQYQIPGKHSPWLAMNWRYDSGLVAGAAPCYGVNANNDCPQTIQPGDPNYVAGEDLIYMQDPFGNALSADEEYQAGFHCGTFYATPTTPIPGSGGVGICNATEFGSSLVKVPAPNTEDDDHNPPRIAPRGLFDAAIGDDNLFNTGRYRVSVELTAINISNKYALYNFLSTFSGTHYVTPRAMTAQIGFHF